MCWVLKWVVPLAGLEHADNDAVAPGLIRADAFYAKFHSQLLSGKLGSDYPFSPPKKSKWRAG